MKKLFVLLLTFCLCLPLFAACDSGETTTETKATTESTTEKVTDEASESTNEETTEKSAEPEEEIPSAPSEGLEFVSNGNGTCYVKSAGTFTGEALVIPSISPEGDKVIKIGKSAFESCETINTLIIHDGIETIGDHAFKSCSSLENISIPKSIKSIGLDAFANCFQIQAVYITDLAAWANIRFNCETSNPITYTRNFYINGKAVTDLAFPDSLTEIKDYTFTYYEGLRSVTFGEKSKVSVIGRDAFLNCRNLISVILPPGLDTIRNNAFKGCYRLVEVVGPSHLLDRSNDNGCINHYSLNKFYNRTEESGLVENNGFIFCQHKNTGEYYLVDYFGNETVVTLPDSINGNDYKINSYAFYARSHVIKLNISNGVTEIGNYAFSNCSGLKNIVFSSNSKLARIGYESFYKCESLENLTFPNSLMTILPKAFYLCSNLKTVDFEENSQLKVINGQAFAGCNKLTSITLPSSLTYIVSQAFSGCESLASAIFENTQGWSTSIGDISPEFLEDPTNAAKALFDHYDRFDWECSQ